jgi:uncharacterized protein (TIGR02594 family)
MLNNALKVALGQYGTRGIWGKESEEQVLKYYHDIGFEWVQDDDLAWCAGFLNWCLLQGGYKFLKSLRARDFLNYGVEISKPEIGDIVIFWRISKDSVWGHVGFYICETDNVIYILGGNQSNSVDIAPFPKTQVLGYRRII